MIDKELSVGLRIVAGISALLVVAIHCWSPVSWFDGTLCENSVCVSIQFLLTCSLSRAAVPVFFVMTGYFLGLSYSNSTTSRIIWYRTLLIKRIRTLYFPFVIWNALGVSLYMLTGKYGCTIGNWGIISTRILGWNFYERLGCGPFWYIQAIMAFYILSPIVISILRNGIARIVFLIVLLYGCVWNGFHYLPLPLKISNYCWLAFGLYAGLGGNARHLQRLSAHKAIVLWLLCASIVVRVVSGVQRLIGTYDLADWFVVCFGVCAMAMYARTMGSMFLSNESAMGCRLLQIVMKQSFWIYAFHTMVISMVGLIIGSESSSFFAYLARLAGGVFGSIVCGMLLHRYAPKLFFVLTGGRM